VGPDPQERQGAEQDDDRQGGVAQRVINSVPGKTGRLS
jgi:hypothetical protein